MAFPMIGAGIGIGVGISMLAGGGWGRDVGHCCRRMLGNPRNRNMAKGALLGGLFGGLMGGIGGGLFGAGIGALLGGVFGGHQSGHHCHHQHPSHQHCGSYPPMHGHHFGGPHFGGYHCPGNYGHHHHGAPHWHGGGHCSPNYNFGHCHRGPQHHACHCRPCHGHRPEGQLCQKGKGKPISYTTSGGYKVNVNKHTITITDPNGKNVLKHWGDPHENLNGKHLKDWEGKQRSIVLGDGTKITMTADGPHGVTRNTSIYDGRQNVQINNDKNQIKHHSFNPWDTAMREARQYDGETSIFRTNRNGAAIYNNIYTEDKNFGINYQYKAIGRTGGYNNPSKTYDFYDDPRLRHT